MNWACRPSEKPWRQTGAYRHQPTRHPLLFSDGLPHQEAV
ncbi:hypothetical protein NEIELOOT_02390 [Neisseria elongata subsp. glycolytica ATCC 29315]|uniref:Uncharacterized protein n=1 Tax=Neisseria elongata subsp. glycolytica ATCC 29315 TaxID=546263 RepID=D4DTI4_NEIEG|nr:hypothetical protein NEIELOOT_02390 [Neisseria elongata subsp. glycolytica ATCC 29315]